MTREEAIEWLTDIKENVTENWSQATDVYKAHEEEHLNIMNRIKELQYAIAKTQTIVGKMVESAEVKPTVIRSKTLLPTKDFKEWAKRVRDGNPNVIVIPCDAEVVSADAVHIHNDGTLEVKVSNAQKVGRVLVMDTDSHIGGGLFYPDNAVEVVRCKDCKHKYEDGEVTHYYWCRLHDRPVDDTDYCAWGEKREVEE